MKFSFSTVGCPNWLWSEITAAALDLGYDGIELRGLGADLFVPEIKIFQPARRAATRGWAVWTGEPLDLRPPEEKVIIKGASLRLKQTLRISGP